MEKLPQFEVEQPMYVATTDSQKIGHTALNTDECPPQGSRGMYKVSVAHSYLPFEVFVLTLVA